MSEPEKNDHTIDDQPAKPRSAARLGAVQALYQMDVVSTDLTDIIEEYTSYRLGHELDGEVYNDADLDFFRCIVTGVVAEQKTIDPHLNKLLAEGWRLSRIDSILRAILRAAAYELEQRFDIPAKVIINEYIDIAHAFFDGEESKVVNGVLHKLAKQFRPDELNQIANG
jgi:N utilization substance protein B